MSDKLLITIKNAELYKNIEFTKMDPYVVINIGSQRFKTKTHHYGGKHPKWNETTTMLINYNQNSGHISVWDKDTFTADDLIGECNLDLYNTRTLGTKNNVFELYKKGKLRGTIYIDFEFVNKNSYNSPIPGYQQQPNYQQQNRFYPPQPGYNPQPNFPPQPGYNPQPNFPPQPGYKPQPNFPPQPGYNPQPNFPPQPGYNPQPNFPPQPEYNPQPNFQPQPGYNPQPNFPPQPEYNPQPNFQPQPGYNPQSGFPRFPPY